MEMYKQVLSLDPHDTLALEYLGENGTMEK
jgi:hypothetical protein